MLVECAFTILNLRLLLNPVMQLSVLATAYYNSGALAAQVTVKVIEFISASVNKKLVNDFQKRCLLF